jgi:hypothetical protein
LLYELACISGRVEIVSLIGVVQARKPARWASHGSLNAANLPPSVPPKRLPLQLRYEPSSSRTV